ncbi:MAG: C4-dicarboxylate ABC transporter permease [Hyphomicrobiales bacterium]|nr:MAG: C4-dicarboxylate ABC transporter permease [Hyphomicrobiales bacterium]
MPRIIIKYVRIVDAINLVVGRFAMYLLFVMLGILLWSSISKSFFTPALWTLEMAQFTMVAYYLLGGGHSMQLGAHVRMDLVYGKWKPYRQSWVDVFTVMFLIFFLVILLYGGISSTIYAFEYGETSRSIWAPKMAPVKVVMDIGIFLTLLQAIAVFFKDLGIALDRPIP